jgi:hypothetical protein
MRAGPLSVGRVRLALAAGCVILLIAVVVAAVGGGGSSPPLPLPGIGRPARSGDPFGYQASHESAFVSRAIAGSAPVIYAKSPGGVIATAARVDAFRGLIDAAAHGTSVDPNVLEGIVYLESAGRPNVIAGSDPAAAAGLSQILASTGHALLGMHIDLAQSRKLTRRIDIAYSMGQSRLVARLQRQRARVDDRFNPRLALAGTVRYLQIAQQRFGRGDLAVVSYHMGIGNLHQVLSDYNGGQSVPYAQLFFDTAPDRHTTAYRLLQGFGDDSSLYYWRVLGAVQIMHLYRTDRSALSRLNQLQSANGSGAQVLHPPDRTRSFGDPSALRSAYADRSILRLPANPGTLGLRYDPGMGSLASQLGQPADAYRGLRPAALDLLVELAARVRSLSSTQAPLTVVSTVTDNRYQKLLGGADPSAVTGYTFELARRYASHAQAAALQAMLDRLQALNLIAWIRWQTSIEVTVASDASQVIVGGI